MIGRATEDTLFRSLMLFMIIFVTRIMFLYLRNMYVLVISLLNKINQVSFFASYREKIVEMKIDWTAGNATRLTTDNTSSLSSFSSLLLPNS